MLTPLLLLTLGLTDAAAATTVRLVLDRPLDTIPAGSTAEALPDGPLPSGEEFVLTVDLPPGVSATAALSVWPAQGRPCAAAPPADGPQRHTVGMAPDGDVLSGRVPALQVGQTYCLSLAPRLMLGEEGMARLAEQAAAELTLRLPDARSCDLDSGWTHFAKALSGGLAAAGFGAADASSLEAAAREAQSRYRRGPGPDACAALVGAQGEAQALQSILDAEGARLPSADRASMTQDVLSALQTAQSQTETLTAALIEALNATSVRQRIVVATGPVTLGAQTATAATRDAVNFAVPAAGVSFVWWPDQSPALVGWGGVSFYSTAVDRDVPLNELAGSPGDVFRQRVSLTVAVARDAEPARLHHLPGLGQPEPAHRRGPTSHPLRPAHRRGGVCACGRPQPRLSGVKRSRRAGGGPLRRSRLVSLFQTLQSPEASTPRSPPWPCE
ncbi:MAG: hypothetical protein IPI35_35345 [Deltaproteobacteria bacterium]|nr:hypothetical protein [Deltaproteobacteria bacterium]